MRITKPWFLAVIPQNGKKITTSGTKKLKITKPPNLAVNPQNVIHLGVIPQSEKYFWLLFHRVKNYLAVSPQSEK